MGENYWKGVYQDTWDESSKRERRLMTYLVKLTGIKCEESGLGGQGRHNTYQEARQGMDIKRAM